MDTRNFRLVPMANKEGATHLDKVTFKNENLVIRRSQSTMKGLDAGGNLHGPHAGSLLQQFLPGGIKSYSTGLPQWPVNRARAPMPLPGCHQLIAIRPKLIHKTICSGIVGLSNIPHCSRSGGKQHEEIQFDIFAGLIEVKCTDDLWRQYLSEFLNSLLKDEAISNHPGTVDNAVQLSVLLLDCSNELRDLIQIKKIQLPIADPVSLLRQLFQ